MSIETTVIPIRTNGQTIKLIASSAGPGLASRGPTCWPMILHEARRPVTAGDAARGVRHHAVTNPFCPSAVPVGGQQRGDAEHARAAQRALRRARRRRRGNLRRLRSGPYRTVPYYIYMSPSHSLTLLYIFDPVHRPSSVKRYGRLRQIVLTRHCAIACGCCRA